MERKLLQYVSLPRPVMALSDRFGRLPIQGVKKFLMDGYHEANKQGFPTELIKHAFFIREKVVCSPKLHRNDFPMDQKFMFRMSIASVGTTSYSVFQELYDPSTMERLLRSETKLVNVDPETRRPTNLPKLFVEQSSKFKSGDCGLITEIQKDIVPPNNAFRTITRTRYSDMDTNLHVNFAEYYGFCADCASEASQSGYYRHYADDIGRFPVLQTDVTFIRESPSCSNLDVYTWQDTGNVQIIYFAIYLKSDRILLAQFLYDYKASFIASKI
ncbi:uncharacterized protein LOC117322443 [Pecten maximus]|uniref:uncharacterized protein LOC117322443 n=1 Tax=Pecten maximus TaxID=6579 RepID=UPI0014588BCD|nr:uncharacterized protein LOC117322443 [Pecten maximus]XP_033733251.1 uncharacterized protein LOC117322443 [Pecten maximus]XP_033733252.1 uncharacterized protein LOC117322443 [Pecten maximus]